MRIKKSNKFIWIILIGIVALLLIVYTAQKNKVNYNNLTEEEIAEAVNQEVKDMQTSKLSSMSERDRMEYYVSKFIKAVENRSYDTAYNMLYDEFKENYFKTLESFEEYAKNNFPKMISLEYENIERNGKYYVLFVRMSNMLGNKNDGTDMNFVVKENDLNDFVLSFSVK